MALSLLAGCAPKPLIQVYKTYPSLPEASDFVVFEPTDSVDVSAAEKLGDIVIKPLWGTNCDYATVVDSATRLAKNWGANALKIVKHTAPGLTGPTSCNRIQARAYRFPSIDPHLKSIPWRTERRLRIADFKADTAFRPFEAASVVYIRLSWELRPSQKEAVVVVRALFERPMSYFKTYPDSLEVLAHEQGHFDLAEAYARRLRKSILQGSFRINNWNTEIQKLYDATNEELQKRQDNYDHDTYLDRKVQPGWLARIQADLNTYPDYLEPKLIVKLTK